MQSMNARMFLLGKENRLVQRRPIGIVIAERNEDLREELLVLLQFFFLAPRAGRRAAFQHFRNDRAGQALSDPRRHPGGAGAEFGCQVAGGGSRGNKFSQPLL
jgi:hypothetical protein